MAPNQRAGVTQVLVFVCIQGAKKWYPLFDPPNGWLRQESSSWDQAPAKSVHHVCPVKWVVASTWIRSMDVVKRWRCSSFPGKSLRNIGCLLNKRNLLLAPVKRQKHTSTPLRFKYRSLQAQFDSITSFPLNNQTGVPSKKRHTHTQHSNGQQGPTLKYLDKHRRLVCCPNSQASSG